jgi:hypothetical protein
VVGLTASVGVGKAKSVEEAADWIRQSMANLDSEELCTVRHHMDELNQKQNRPQEGIHHLLYTMYLIIKCINWSILQYLGPLCIVF